jgi:hypothetical protein
MSESAPKLPSFYDPQLFGASMKEWAVDIVDTESQQVVSRTYRSEFDAHLTLWFDARNNIIKQQAGLLGAIAEWNLLEGCRTGYHAGDEEQEKVLYDKAAEVAVLRQCCDWIAFMDQMSPQVRAEVINNFKYNKVVFDLTPAEMAQRFGHVTPQRYELSFFKRWLGLLGRLGRPDESS